ncbi:serine hydrolase domain-containing protein [Paenibacillus agilis]|uniref:Beta-lactamase family protein n=1 Tax=Paenibacillus agilis TaxID=3020863 RepID=A0A559IK68_9BACL|nr:serine hydrolase domain-containing protein [Paenibacillus agilis]TVX88066.1 beta-lactamase family protein [Paenibacillus agilis]
MVNLPLPHTNIKGLRKKRRVMISALLVIATLFLFSGDSPVPINDHQPPHSLHSGKKHQVIPQLSGTELVQRRIEQVAHRMEVPGVIAVAKRNGELFSYAAGEASIEDKKPIKTTHAFRIASVTKTFVATVVLQLVEEQKLSLEDTVEEWLPGIVQGNGYDGNKITIRQLLNHTSGIPDYITEDFYIKFHKDSFRTFMVEELIQEALSAKPLFDPGTSWAYSNTNTLLVGQIIEQVTEEPYRYQIKKRIIDPLELACTSLPDQNFYIPCAHARGYIHSAEQLYDYTEHSPTWLNAAGEMISTAEDLVIFYEALLGGRLLKPEQLQEMLTTVETPWNTNYGLGIEEFRLYDGPSVWGHGGSTHGFTTAVRASRNGRHVIAVNANVSFDTGYVSFDGIIEAEMKRQ